MYYECRNGSILKVLDINTGECEVVFSADRNLIKHGGTIVLAIEHIPQLKGTILRGGAHGEGWDVIGKAPAKLMNAARKISYIIWYGGAAVSIMLGGWIAFKLFS